MHQPEEGGPDEIVRYFAGVCESLRDLPLERLETERNVLRSEAASRSRTPLDQIGLWRHGARDYGLLSYPEFGLDRLAAADVVAWSARWFTRPNAVFWMVGEEIPPGLRLALPDGARMPLPTPSSALPDCPSYFPGSPRAIGADGIDALEGLSLDALTRSPKLALIAAEMADGDTVEIFERR